MKITIKNLPSNQRIQGIKAVRYSLKQPNGERFGLRDAKDLVDASIASSAHPDRYDVTGEMQDTDYVIDRYGYPVECGKRTTDNIKDYVLSNCFRLDKNVKVIFHDPIKKIETKGKQIFNVPNDEDGQAFMDRLERYLNRPQYTFRRRGRGSRKEAGDQSYVPLNASEWIAVYINELSATQTENKALKDKVERLERELKDYEQDGENYEAEIQGLEKTVDDFYEENNSLKVQVEQLQAENRMRNIKNASKKANEHCMIKVHEDKKDSNVKTNHVTIRTITWTDTVILPN